MLILVFASSVERENQQQPSEDAFDAKDELSSGSRGDVPVAAFEPHPELLKALEVERDEFRYTRLTFEPDPPNFDARTGRAAPFE